MEEGKNEKLNNNKEQDRKENLYLYFYVLSVIESR